MMVSDPNEPKHMHLSPGAHMRDNRRAHGTSETTESALVRLRKGVMRADGRKTRMRQPFSDTYL